VPRFYCGDYSLDKEERGFYLILNDISSQYKLKSVNEGLNFMQINDILVKIAKFHCAAYAFQLKNPEKVKTWNLKSWYEKASDNSGFLSLMEDSFEDVIKDFENEKSDLLKSVLNLKMKWLEVFKDQNSRDKGFISHGDLWLNNVMINEKTDETIILDWQTLCPDHPVFDVWMLILTSLTPENLENWAYDLIRNYVATFQESCLQFKTKIPFNHEEFHNLFFDDGFMLFFSAWKSMGDQSIRRIKIVEAIKEYCQLVQKGSPPELSTLINLYGKIMVI